MTVQKGLARLNFEGKVKIVEGIQVWGSEELSCYSGEAAKVEILVTAIQQPFMDHLVPVRL